MTNLNLPEYEFCIKKDSKRTTIFDIFRKKHVALTPEEWVRQNFLKFLTEEKKYKPSLIIVEASIKYHSMQKRCDAIIYDNNGNPVMIIECKSTKINLNQSVFDQAVRYNFPLKVKYLTMTNGLKHYCCKIDYQKGKYTFLEDIPYFNELY